MVGWYAEAVASWRAVWIDGGTRDEWHLDIGAQAFHREVVGAGHGGIEYRYPLALA
jgi:hypothetical protein